MIATNLLVILMVQMCFAKYDPNWESLDSRPIPTWYDEAKLGIFIHWGVFSVPSFGSEWFWYYWKTNVPSYVDFMTKNYRPDWTYADFASQFTAEFYDPDQWADILKASGAKYVVLVSKHSEGFSNWQTKHSFNWNSMSVGPKRDLVGDLANAVRKRTDLKFGFYYCLKEWFNPLYLQDVANNFTTQDYVRDKISPQQYELVNMYKPDLFWSDYGIGPYTYWNSTNFLAWLYNESPVKDNVVVNDRWGDDCQCKHGGYWTCHDRYNPGVLQKHKWENCMTIDKGSWGYRRNVDLATFLTVKQIIDLFAETISCGGNLLMNIGPTHDGRIIPLFEERLRQLGSWLDVNGEAVYKSVPWIYQNDTVTKGVWYTHRIFGSVLDMTTAVYAFVLKYPEDNTVMVGAPSPSDDTRVTMLGYDGEEFKWTRGKNGGMLIEFPVIPSNKLPCDWAWVLKLENLDN